MINYKLDSNLKFSKVEDLIDLPLVVTVNKFDETSAKNFREDMQKAMNENKKYIPVVIDSYGGQVYALLSMIQTVKSAQENGFIVPTISTGKSMSCGSILFAMGTDNYRYIDKYSTLMIHEVSSGCHGKVEEIKADANEAIRLNQLVFELMSESCGKTKNYFINLIHEKNHADWYLDSAECIKHNLANHIGHPKFNVSIDVNITFSV